MLEAILGVTFFSAIVFLLALLVLVARRFLVPYGECEIDFNTHRTVSARIGQRLLEVCQGAGILLPSACGGAGTCGLCKMRVLRGGGEAGVQELALLNRREVKQGTRLACQVSVVGPMSVEVEESYFSAKTWHCQVERARNVSTLIREIVLRLPAGEYLDFRAGGFVQLSCPPFQVAFSDFDIDARFHDVWDRYGLWELHAGSEIAVTRAYSMANHPAEKGVIILNVRIALPPPGQPQAAPGVVSSWLFSLKPGDTIEADGPFGHFFVESSDREVVFIGGGAGMAPLRSHIFHLFHTLKTTDRKVSYWYGGRSRAELFYTEDFRNIEKDFDNFKCEAIST